MASKIKARHSATQPSWKAFFAPTPVGFATFAHAKCAVIIWLQRGSGWEYSPLIEELLASTSDGRMPVHRQKADYITRSNDVNLYFALFNLSSNRVKEGFREVISWFSGLFQEAEGATSRGVSGFLKLKKAAG